jgi:hypothetical protein
MRGPGDGENVRRSNQTRRKPTMRRLALSTLAALALAMPALAGDLTMETVLGTTMDEVKASLTRLGYEVRKAEIEDGQVEAYVVGNGRMGEVYVSAETGKPTRIVMK